jgi:hypothetical protein
VLVLVVVVVEVVVEVVVVVVKMQMIIFITKLQEKYFPVILYGSRVAQSV